MSLACFPLELLECLVRDIDAHQDLLSFALTCSHLHDIIIPNHLDYRSLCVSTHHTQLWDHLLTRPDLAKNVRALTLYVGHPEVFVPMFRDEARVTFRAPRGLADVASWLHPPTDTLAAAFRVLRAARALELHVSWIPDDDEPQDVDAFRSALGVLDAACAHMPALDELTICAPGIYEQEQEKEGEVSVWGMRELRKIDFHAFGQCVFTYPGLTRFCDMLILSKKLEELHVSMDVRVLETLADNPLPSLKHFFVYNVGTIRLGDEAVAMRFLEAHPGLETLQLPRLFKDWQSAFAKPILPHIKALLELPQVFLRCVLGGRAPQSLHVHTLGDFALTADTLPLLEAIDPSRLRRVRLAKIDAFDTLRELSKMFPALEELLLPPTGAKPPSVTYRARARVCALRLALHGGHVCMQPHLAALPLRDVVPLFPALRVVSFVQTSPSAFVPFRGDVPSLGCVYHDRKFADVRRVRRALNKIQRRYPNLTQVNGWKL